MTHEEFKKEIVRLQPMMQHTAEKIVGDPDNAADAVQEAVINLWEKRDSLSQGKDTERLCLTVVKRRSIDMLRRQKPIADIEAENLMLLEIPEEDPWEERYQRARKLVDQLPERQRNAILMKYEEGLSNKEIEQATGMSSTHLYATLSRAYKALRNAINQHKEE